MLKLKNIGIFALALGISAAAAGADAPASTILVQNGQFKPASITVPSGQKIHLIIKNNDSVQAEFESYPLNREEKVEPGAQIDVYVGPLDAGEYPFFDDNNPDAKGMLVAK